MAKLDALMTSARNGDESKDEWRTPLWLFNLLNQEFSFDLDPCATQENRLCPYHFTKKEDGLKEQWTGATAFVNPPYSQMREWVKKSYTEAYEGRATVVMLVAARTDTRGWWDYVRYGQVRFLKGRLKFGIPPEKIEEQRLEAAERALRGKATKVYEVTSAPFPSAIVVFHRYMGESSTIYWGVKELKDAIPK